MTYKIITRYEPESFTNRGGEPDVKMTRDETGTWMKHEDFLQFIAGVKALMDGWSGENDE